MPSKRNQPEVKAVEEWTAKEWETAYNLLVKKYDKLRDHMRVALNLLSKAQTHLTEAVA